jgi:hypothetical protein
MRRRATPLLLALLCAGILHTAAYAEAPAAPTRRFALVMGANKGGEGNVRLRYATSDARSFADLLTELGGVRPEDLVLLLDPPLSAFRDSAERLRAQATMAGAAGQRCELVLYYSGHSDEAGLLFEKEKLPYADLRAAIERVPAAVRVAILDSCSSGSLTRPKGGASRPAFLFDASSDMEGHAYITSSSAAEAAQESDKIGGSFFTHHLVSALRGAADVRGLGKVTLNDAYAYAFRETLASTEKTQYGPQHPAYEISLTGSGDLVFTDLRSSRAGLALDEELSGSIYIRDAKGNLAVELDKEAGGRMEIGLPQGKYAVAMVKGESRMQADVVVPASGRAFLSPGDFRVQAAAEKTTIRGLEVVDASDEGESGTAQPEKLVYETLVVGFPISFDAKYKPDLSNGIFSSDRDKVVSFSALWGQARDVKVQFALLASADSGSLKGFQWSSLANAVQGRAVGVQLTSLVNAALGGFSGAQISSLVNYAREESHGAQVGLVNIASRIKGAQIGLVNISERIDGAPLGLVNIEKGGIRTVQCWAEGISAVNVGFAFGTRFVYTLIEGGIGMDGKRPHFGIGTGGRLTIAPFYGDIDVSWRSYVGDGSWRSEGDGGGISDVSSSSSRLCLRVLGGFPSQGTGLLAGLAIEGLMPGISRDDDGDRVTEFTAIPTFLLGLKL